MSNAYRYNASLACPIALKAAVSKARVLTSNCCSGRGNAVGLIADPVRTGARFEAGVGRFLGPVARQRFLSQLG